MDIDLNTLRLFVQVVQAGGYAKASRAFGIPRATLSRRIAALEEQLGLRLIERSSRSFRLTPPGETLFRHGLSIMAEAQEAVISLESGQDAPRGLIRFAVAPSVFQLALDRMVNAYLAAYPEVAIQIEATNRRVDLLREGFDFAIRAGTTRGGPLDQVVLPLAEMAHVLVISPALRDGLRPTVAETLAHIPALGWSAAGRAPRWRLVDRNGKTVELSLTPRLTVEDMAALRAAAMQGLGMALLPRIMAEDALRKGDLIAPDFDLRAPVGHIHAVHLGTRGMRPVVRHFLDRLREDYRGLCVKDS